MSLATTGEVFLSRVDSQMVPVRPGEPLWPGPGYQVWERHDGGPRTLVGFIPEAAAADLVEDYRSQGVHVSITGGSDA